MGCGHQLIAQGLQSSDGGIIGLQARLGCARLDEDGGDQQARGDRSSTDDDENSAMRTHSHSLAGSGGQEQSTDAIKAIRHS
ncbi:MAG: hypothetical protein M3R32_00535 [Chloroflexota bacterium]|nr:hypothetical protein [Chloroflexota bacterium]